MPPLKPPTPEEVRLSPVGGDGEKTGRKVVRMTRQTGSGMADASERSSSQAASV